MGIPWGNYTPDDGSDGSVGVLDNLKSAGAGALDWASSKMAGVRAGIEATGDEAEGWRGAMGVARHYADQLRDSRSAAAKDADAHPGDHWVGGAAQSFSASALPIVEGIGSGVLGTLVGGPAGGAAAAAADMAQQQVAGHLKTIYDMVDSTSKDVLLAKSDKFRAFYDTAKKQFPDDPEQAEDAARRAMAGDMMHTGDLLLQAGVGAGAGAVGAQLFGKMIPGKNALTRILLSSAESTSVLEALGTAGDYGQQGSAYALGLGPPPDVALAMKRAAPGAFQLGVPFGVLAGARAHPTTKALPEREPTTTQIDPLGADPAQKAAIAAENPTPTQSVPQEAAPVYEKPAAPVVDHGDTVPERPETIQAQQDALTDPGNARKAQFFPNSSEVPPIPDGMKSVKVRGGTVHYDPAKVKAGEVQKMVRENRLNELLDLGPVSKEEALARAEVKAAAGTEETAPAQVKALEETKTPGNTVQVEAPNKIIADREAAPAASVMDLGVPREIDVEPHSRPTAGPEEMPATEPMSQLVVKPKRPAKAQAAIDAGAKKAKAKADAARATEEVNKPKERASSVEEFIAKNGVTRIPEGATATKNEKGETVVSIPTARETERAARTERGEGRKMSTREERLRDEIDSVAESVFNEHVRDVELPTSLKEDGKISPQEKKHLAARLEVMLEGARDAEEEMKGRYRSEIGDDAKMQENEERRASALRTVDGVKLIQQRNGDRVTGHRVYLRDAEAMLNKLRSGKASYEEITTFLADEAAAKRGDFDTLKARRKQVGEEIKSAKNVSDKSAEHAEEGGHDETDGRDRITEHAASPEEAMVKREEAIEKGEFEDEQEAYEAGRDRKKVETSKEDVVAGKDAKGSGKMIIQKARLVKNPDGTYSRVKGGIRSMAREDFGDPPQHEAEAVQRAIEGKSAVEVADWLSKNADGAWHRFIANRVKQAIKRFEDAGVKFDFRVAHLGDRIPRSLVGARGLTITNFKESKGVEVWVNGADVDGKVGTSSKVVLHELLHSVTQAAIDVGNRRVALGTELARHVSDLMEVSNAIVRHFNNRAEAFARGKIELSDIEREYYDRRNNALANQHEIVAWAMTDERVANYLESIPYKKSNLFSRFVESVRNLLGLSPKQDTALSEVIRITDHLLDADPVEVRDLNTVIGRSMNVELGPLTDKVKGELSDRGTNLKGWMRGLGRTLSTNTMIAHGAEKYGKKFGEFARQAVEMSQRMRSHRQELLRREGGGLEIATKGAELARLHPEEFARAADLAFKASEYNVNLGPDAVNEHLGEKATKGWQAKAKLPEMQAEYNKLSKPIQDWLQKAVVFGREEQNAKNKAQIENILKSAGLYDKDLAQRAFDQRLTDADRELFSSDAALKHLENAINYARLDGWYLPFMREGEHVVSGRREIAVNEDQYTRKIVDANGDVEVQFSQPGPRGGDSAARAAAEEFVSGHELRHVNTRKVWVDKADHTKILPKEDPNSIPAYRVRMQDRHVEFLETEAEARRAEKELAAQGLKDVSYGLKAENPAGPWNGLMHFQFEAFIKSLEGKDSFKNMSAAQQRQMINAMRETNIRLLPGNRIQKHNLKRQNVSGYSTDIIRSLSRYAEMSAGHRAKLEYQPAIDAALEGMQTEMKSDKGNWFNAQRGEVYRELETRLYGNKDIEPNGLASTVTRRLLQASMLDKLAGPSFHVINSMEPWTTSLPVIGGRHGFINATRALKDAYNMIGARGGIVAGAKDTVKAFNHDLGFTDYQSMFKQEMLRNVGGDRAKRLGQVIDHLHDLNLFSHEAGMELQRVAEPSTNWAGRTLDRADLMARQMGSAIEAINRATTGIAAYEMEYRKTGSHEGALRYAHDVVHDTMGNYDMSNASPMFNSNVGRIALQFKKFAQKTYYLLGKSFRGMIAGDKEAAKQFAGLMFTHAMVAGFMGLPLEPIKVALLASNALGLSKFGWDEFEQLVRSTSNGLAGGPVGGEILARGIPRALGVDLSARMELSSLLTFGQPKSPKAQDLKAWLFDTMAGAPVGTVLNGVLGSQELAQGNFGRAYDKLVPLKAARDVRRAVAGYMEPKTDSRGRPTMDSYSLPEAAVKAVGFTPTREARHNEARSAAYSQTQNQKTDTRELTDAWVNAKPEEKAKVWAKIEAFNRGVPADEKVTMKMLTNAMKTRKRYNEENILGIAPTNKNRAMLENTQRMYNVE